MNARLYWIAYQTIVIKEVSRFMRIWLQTLLPPAITMALYFVIFGTLIGARVGSMSGISYVQFIAPGLIMMAVITNSYSNVVSSFFGSKYQKHLEEMLVAPIPNYVILCGYVTGGALRGVIVGTVVTLVALAFTSLHVKSPVTVLAVVVLTAILFSLAGLINAIFARKFDDISIVPTFVLTPMIYLGGVFYSVDLLPPFWRHLSMANPILYVVNAFRHGMLGVSDVSISAAFVIVIAVTVVLFALGLLLLERGTGIKT